MSNRDVVKKYNAGANKKTKQPPKWRAQEQLYNAVMAKVDEMTGNSTPAKSWTKTTTKVNHFNSVVKGVPGGRGLKGFLRMCEAPETGTLLAGPTVLRRLQNSAINSWTTKGNYNAVVGA